MIRYSSEISSAEFVVAPERSKKREMNPPSPALYSFTEV
jgi:hypothetical protein